MRSFTSAISTANQSTRSPEQAIEANAKIIEKTGEDAAVLLKNEGSVLPLKASDLDSVVLIGPTAAQVDSIGINGERSVGFPERQVGPLEAMKKISGNSRIGFAVDDDMTGTPVPASVFSHDGAPGLERTVRRANLRSTRSSTSPSRVAMRFLRTPLSPGKAP